MWFRFVPFMDFAAYLGIAEGAIGRVEESVGAGVTGALAGNRITLVDGRRFTVWGECIGYMAEGAD